ncbi:LuxR family transcriptional regulator [Candidatus Fukatsuia symbiotica]|uniref:LuxR family transcriptional regulator n=2 Tax=Yersiniaceae TaxID=1903411 RepID=A0A2U8I8E3_9GAMM|nr:LuxR family transcriptional regulator [Candidatus Fukatsuia symbiotica]
MDEVNCRKETESHKLIVESLNSLSFRSFMDISEHSWGVKDRESRFVYMNPVALDMCNIPVGFDVEGRLDDECPAPWAEFASDFRKQDRETEKSGKNVAIITTQYYGRQPKLEPYYAEKSPLYNKIGECIGTIWCAKKFNFLSISQYVNKLTPSVLILEPPVCDTFDDKELEVMFYLQQSLPSKVIAQKLNISYCMLEGYRGSIYQKAGVNSMKQFQEFCESTGFNRYIPKELIQPGVQFV